jgi:peroxiredoxin
MVMTPSQMVPLGTPAPDFSLPNVDGRTIALADRSDAPATLVMFICNHCPFVKHVRGELARIGRDYIAQGVFVVAINSNDAEQYPDDSPARMREEARAQGYTFPYLFDATQEVARAYGAVCTPDFFVFDRAGALAYRGQLDASRPSNTRPVDGADLRAALDAVIAGREVPSPQLPSVGCNIKWRGR